MAAQIRLLLVDDHALFRESVARLLQSERDFKVVAQCGSVADALEIIRSRPIDVVLLDWDLGAEKGSEFMEQCAQAGFRGKVLLVTAGIHEVDAAELIKKGIAGVIMKHKSPELLVQSIQQVMEGKSWFDQEFLKKAITASTLPQAGEAARLFTERERQVLSLVFEGFANKEIAARLHVSESSVKASLQQLFDKTGVRTRSQLVRIVLERYRDQI